MSVEADLSEARNEIARLQERLKAWELQAQVEAKLRMKAEASLAAQPTPTPTPTTAGVTEAQIERAYEAFTRSFGSKPIGTNNTRDDLRAALEAALAPPGDGVPSPSGWSVRGAEAYRLFPTEDEAREYAGSWGLVRPVYDGPFVDQPAPSSDDKIAMDRDSWRRAALSAAPAGAEPVAYAYVVGGECEEIGWGEPPIDDDPSLVRLFAGDGVPGMVLVPKTALDWLFGEGPDVEGHWFGDGNFPMKGAYWWRSPFRAMIDASTAWAGK